MCFLTSRFANICAQIKQIMSNIQPLDVGGRDSETQLQVDANFNQIT